MKMRATPLRCAFVCAITLLTSSLVPVSTGFAQGKAPDRARARELYAQGQHFFKEGSYESALVAFEEAHRVLPNPVVLLSIAECQVRTERYEAAVGTLKSYLASRPNAPDAAQVQQQLEAVQQKPARVEVVSTPDGVELTVDGATVTATTPTTLEVPSGTHTIAAKAQGYLSSKQTLTLGIGERKSITFSLNPLPVAAPVASAPVEVPASTERHRHADAMVWSAVGVAGAGFVVGGILGGLALKTKSDFDDHPTAHTADKGERLALFADVGFGIGAAASVTALILYLTSDAPAAEATVSFAPVAGKNRVGLVSSLRF